MATAVAFDTLKLARKLEAAGFEHKQAADTAEALAEAMTTAELATKADIAAARAETKADLRESELRLEARIDRLEASTKADSAAIRAEMKAMELRLVIKLGMMLAAFFTMAAGTVAVVVRLMMH